MASPAIAEVVVTNCRRVSVISAVFLVLPHGARGLQPPGIAAGAEAPALHHKGARVRDIADRVPQPTREPVPRGLSHGRPSSPAATSPDSREGVRGAELTPARPAVMMPAAGSP